MKMKIEHLKFTMETKLFPIIGYPMGQSSASYGYNPLFAANDINEIMWPVEIPVGGLGDFMAAFKTLGMKHFCLTMPHKSAIIPYLDEVDPLSKLFNSVNVVKVNEQGKTVGIGMDGKGNMAAIERAGVDVNGMNIFILGAGSIVGVILLELAKRGAKKITLVNRSAERAQTLLEIVRKHTDLEIEYLPFSNENLDKAASECDFFMQSTPLGLFGYPQDHSYLGFMEKLRPEAIVMENIVNPPMTKVAALAKKRGHKVIYGVDMMIGQMGEIFEFCYGYKPADEHLEASKQSVYQYFGITGE
jgi:shikimate dehydrogenase